MERKRYQRQLRKGRISEFEWRLKKKEYIGAKKRERSKKWLLELDRDKTIKLFWKAIGGRREKERVEKSRTGEQWRRHFRGQYTVKKQRKTIGTWE